MEFGKSFCYLWDRLNACNGSEATATSSTRIRWQKFREDVELAHGRKLSMKVKGRIYQICVRSGDAVRR